MADEGILIRKGRERTNWLTTEFSLMDMIMDFALEKTNTSAITVLGFYQTLKRYINRKESTRENQVNYLQSWLMKKMGISTTLYYTCLKMFYNTSLLDIEKTLRVEYLVKSGINETTGKQDYMYQEEDILMFSTLDETNLDFSDGKIVNYIAQIKGIRQENIRLLKVKVLTSYVIHEWPSEESNISNGLTEIRSWDKDMSKFKRSKSINTSSIDTIDERKDECNLLPPTPSLYDIKIPLSDEIKMASSDEINIPSSADVKIFNNINNTPNTIIIPQNSTNTLNERKIDIYNTNKENRTREDKSIDQYHKILSKCQIDLFDNHEAVLVREAIKGLFFDYDFAEKTLNIPLFLVHETLQNINHIIVQNSLMKMKNKAAKGEKITDSLHFLMGCIFKEISASIGDKLTDQMVAQAKFTKKTGTVMDFVEGTVLKDAVEALSQMFSDISFRTWFSTSSVLKFQKIGSTLLILTCAEYNATYIKDRFLPALYKCFEPCGIESIDLQFVTDTGQIIKV